MTMEVILYAVVALLILYRLRNALGRSEYSDINNGINVIDITEFSNVKDVRESELHSIDIKKKNEEALSAYWDDDYGGMESSAKLLRELHGKDKDFDLKVALDGACNAFDLIIKAVNAKDLSSIKDFISDEFYLRIKDAMEKWSSIDVINRSIKVRNVLIERDIVDIHIVCDSEQIIKQVGNAATFKHRGALDYWKIRKKINSDDNWKIFSAEN